MIEYQLAIVATIVMASLLFGGRAMFLVAAGWGVWTLVMIFTSWLMILQFVTIFVSLGVGVSICGSPKHTSYRSTSWTLLVLGAVGLVYLNIQNSNSSTGVVKDLQGPTRQQQAVPASIQQPQPTVQPQYTSTFENTPIYVPPVYVPQDNSPIASDAYQYKTNQLEMQRLLEEARIEGQKYEYARRQCGQANFADELAFNRWSACMAHYGY